MSGNDNETVILILLAIYSIISLCVIAFLVYYILQYRHKKPDIEASEVIKKDASTQTEIHTVDNKRENSYLTPVLRNKIMNERYTEKINTYEEIDEQDEKRITYSEDAQYRFFQPIHPPTKRRDEQQQIVINEAKKNVKKRERFRSEVSISLGDTEVSETENDDGEDQRLTNIKE